MWILRFIKTSELMLTNFFFLQFQAQPRHVTFTRVQNTETAAGPRTQANRYDMQLLHGNLQVKSHY